MVRLFGGVEDKIAVGWVDLIQRLAALPGEPTFRVPYKVASDAIRSELVLGTVQLGMRYGVANRSGMPSGETAIAMVRQAISHGVTALDTARAYGRAEQLVGKALAGGWRSRAEVITKLDPLGSVPHDASPDIVAAAVNESVRRSCEAVNTDRLQTLLLHRWSLHSDWKGAAWRRLLELRDEGKVGVLGASVYEPWEALEALLDPEIKHLQIPMNLLDSRWKVAGVQRVCKERPDVVIHARSVFLQGLLINDGAWPTVASFYARQCTAQLISLANRFEKKNVADLCLSYVLSQPWITAAVVGCETSAQLEEDLELSRSPRLTPEQCEELESSIPEAPKDLLNPAKWAFANDPQPTHAA